MRIRSIVVLSALLATACGPGAETKPERPAVTAGVLPAGGTPADPTGAADFLLDFGAGWVGTETVRTLLLRNESDASIELAVDGATAPFSASGETLVPANGELELRFVWKPTEAGASEAIVSLAAGERQWSVRLAGSARIHAAEGEPHCVPVVPPQLYLGSAAPGGVARGTLRIENRGDAACELSVDAPEGAIFSLGQVPATIRAGGKVEIPVAARPTSLGEVAKNLELHVAGEAHTVALQANGVEQCLAISGSAAFSPIQACTAESRVLNLRNVCDGALTLDTIELDSEVFRVRSKPVLPTKLEQTQSADIELIYVPVPYGPEESRGLFTIHSDRDPAVQVELTGQLAPPPIQENRYSQPFRPRVDLLLVIDDSPAMQPYLSQLRAWARGLGQFVQAQQIVARAAVTTTSLTATEGCAGSGADGRFLPLDGTLSRIAATNDGNFGDAIEARLPSSFCSNAPNRGLDAAIRAVAELGDVADDPAHEEPEDGNFGFPRPDAHLKVIFVSARDDASSADPATWGESLGIEPTRIHLLSAETLFAADSCDLDPSTLRYDEAAGAVGGYTQLACTDPWDPTFPYGVEAFGYKTRFFLTNEPFDRNGDGVISDEAGELEVLVNELPVPSIDETGAEVWLYNKDLNSIDFLPGRVPAEGSMVTVRYAVLPYCL